MAAKKSKDDLRQVLDDEGKVLKGVKVPEVSDDELLRIFDVMMMVRIVVEMGNALGPTYNGEPRL